MNGEAKRAKINWRALNQDEKLAYIERRQAKVRARYKRQHPDCRPYDERRARAA